MSPPSRYVCERILAESRELEDPCLAMGDLIRLELEWRALFPSLEFSPDAAAVIGVIHREGGRMLALDLVGVFAPEVDERRGLHDLAEMGLLDRYWAVDEDGQDAEPLVAVRYPAAE